MIGTWINERYQLESDLGQGGMGRVYRAFDSLLDRHVALKIISKTGKTNLDSNGRTRLLHEAKAAARLNHPNIVSIFDAGEAQGLPFIVMEFIEGSSLQEKRPDGIHDILSVGRQICAALEHAHSHGIIHRDLKPENVMITPEGQAKLTDFGLARSVSSRVSTEGSIEGTVFYMAPELALGKPFDPRSDLYALGVMLYELSTSKLPFGGDDPLVVISQHLHASVIPPRAYNPSVPPALEALILQLLTKDPHDRPASAAEAGGILAILEKLARMEEKSASGGKGLQSEGIQIPEKDLPTLDRLLRGRLVGRENELAELKAVWLRVTSGEGQVLLVSGEPGIGKTRLVRELVARVTLWGGKALVGECYAEGGMPYAPFSQVIQEAFQSPQTGANLPDFVLADLLVMAPELRSRYPQVTSVLAINQSFDHQAEQQRSFESMVALCTAMAEGSPVLLFLDDVHWADSGTLLLVRHLARRTRNLRLLLVMAYREAELNGTNTLQRVLHDLNRERLASRLKLTRLDRQQTRQMLVTLLTPIGEIEDSLVEAIYRETEGNPFFIEEVTKALIEDGRLCYDEVCWVAPDAERIEIPQSVRVAVQTRLSRLPQKIQDTLLMAAILGREFDFHSLQNACEADEESLIETLEVAERAQIILEVPRRRGLSMAFMFAHALIPAALYDSVGGLRRQGLHKRAAKAIEAVHPEDFEALAYHYEQAGDSRLARLNYIQAGDRALSVHANQEAERYYQSALELCYQDSDRSRLLAVLGEAFFRQGQYQKARQSWQKAIEHYQAIGDNDNAARLYARSARSAWYSGDTAGGLALCRTGMASMPAGVETPGLATLLHETARACRFNGLFEEALDLSQKALAQAQRLDLVEVQAETLATLGILPNFPPEEAVQALEQSVGLAESFGLPATAARAHINLGVHMQNFGKLKAARDHFLKAREAAQALGIKSWDYDFLINQAEVSLEMGDFGAVIEVLPVIHEIQISEYSSNQTKLFARLIEARLRHYQGNWDEAIYIFKGCQQEARHLENWPVLIRVNYLLADLLLELGQVDEASQTVDEVLSIKIQEFIELEWLLCQASAVRSRQGRIEEAEKLLTEARQYTHGRFTPRLEELCLWTAARLEIGRQCWQEAFTAYESLISLRDTFGMPWFQARALVEHAEGRLTRGKNEDQAIARQLFLSSLAIYQRLDSQGYVQRIREKLAGAV